MTQQGTKESKLSAAKGGYVKRSFPPFAVRFCPEYIKQAAQAPCQDNCAKLHVCKRWISGCCAEANCKYTHSLLTPSTVQVLGRAGIKIAERGCHDKVRRLLNALFPRICYDYNEGRCANPHCKRLHLCRKLALEGGCAGSTRKQCPYNHAVSLEQNRSILSSFGATWQSQVDIVNLYWDMLVSDSRLFVADCKCVKCFVKQQQNIAVDVDSGSSKNNSDAEDGSETSSLRSAAVSHSRPASIKQSSTQIDSFSKLELRQAFGNCSKLLASDNPITQLTGIVAYLIENCLVVPAVQIAQLLKIDASAVPSQINALRQHEKLDPAFRKQLPTCFEWNGMFYVSMLSVFRICFYHYAQGGCKNPSCRYLHICKNYVAGACTKSGSCPHSHDLQRQPLFPRLGCESLAGERRRTLVRISHPFVCPAYAYDPAGCQDSNCVNLHVCNEAMLGVPCLTLDCHLLKDHDPTSSGRNNQNLRRFGLAASKREMVTLLVLPVKPPKARVPEAAPKNAAPSFQPARDAPQSKPSSQVSLTTNEDVPATKPLLSNKTDKDKFQTVNVRHASRLTNDLENEGPIQMVSAATEKHPEMLQLCERYLRRMCNRNLPIHDGFMHWPKPFCWAYKMPQCEETAAYLQYKAQYWQLETRSFLLADGSRWVAFADDDNMTIEQGFCSPDNRLLTRSVKISENYPFAGNLDIVFPNIRDSKPLRMSTRLKKLASGAKPNLESKDHESLTFTLTKPIDIEVFCLRTPSFAALSGSCLRATKWCWYYKRRDQDGTETWANCEELVGDNAAEIEHAFVSEQTSLSLPAKEYCCPGGFSEARKVYNIDFETMLLSCDKERLQTDVCSRPSFPG